MKAHTKHRLALKKKHCRHRPVILNRPVTYGYGHRSVNCMPAESKQQTMLRTVIEVKYHFLTNFVSHSHRSFCFLKTMPHPKFAESSKKFLTQAPAQFNFSHHCYCHYSCALASSSCSVIPMLCYLSPALSPHLPPVIIH